MQTQKRVPAFRKKTRPFKTKLQFLLVLLQKKKKQVFPELNSTTTYLLRMNKKGSKEKDKCEGDGVYVCVHLQTPFKKKTIRKCIPPSQKKKCSISL